MSKISRERNQSRGERELVPLWPTVEGDKEMIKSQSQPVGNVPENKVLCEMMSQGETFTHQRNKSGMRKIKNTDRQAGEDSEEPSGKGREY